MRIGSPTLRVSAAGTLLLAVAGLLIWSPDTSPTALPTPARIQAVTLDARARPDSSVYAELSAIGVTHVAVTPFGWQERYDTPLVHLRPDARWFTESDEGIREIARHAAAHGMELIIKPHIWLREGAAQQFYRGEPQTERWRDGIGFVDEADWRKWEESYREFMLHYADLAAEVDADVLCIGTELATAASARPTFWSQLAEEVRAVFPGRLTYAANWYREYEAVAFWETLDYVGVQGYFPLSDDPDPSVEMLMNGWERHEAALHAVSVRVGRPVLFTEIGYRSVTSAAARPWVWPSRRDHETMQADSALQARCYEAFFGRVWENPWVAGANIWKWHGTNADHPRRAMDFTPQGKAALEVIRRSFLKSEAPAEPVEVSKALDP